MEEFERESNSKVEYQGKTYTKYEATQVQRKLETSIRQQKDLQIIAKASGDKETIANAQKNITDLTREYKNFSEVAGLDTKMNRLRVVGYKRTSTK